MAEPIPLVALLLRRREELQRAGRTWRQIIDETGLAESTVYVYTSEKTRPFEQSPRRATLEKLARGFRLDLTEVIEAAKQSTLGGVEGTPLQLLVRHAQVETGRSARQAARRAQRAGLSISEATISEILGGSAVNPTPGTIKALAFGYDLDPEAVERAVSASKPGKTYKLPPRIEARLTPERWDRLIRLVEQALDLSDEQ